MHQPTNQPEDKNLSPEVEPIVKRFRAWIISALGVIAFFLIPALLLPFVTSFKKFAASIGVELILSSIAVIFLAIVMIWKLFSDQYKKGKPSPPDKPPLELGGKPAGGTDQKEKPSPPKKNFPWRRTIQWLVAISIIVAMVKFFPVYVPYVRTFLGIQTPPAHPNFRPRQICPVTTTYDYSKKKIDRPLVIILTEGCYGDWYILPAGSRFEANKTTGSDDYVSMWCNGHTSPEPTVEYYTEGMGGELRNGCAAPREATNHFRFQGHGTITFFPITDGS